MRKLASILVSLALSGCLCTAAAAAQTEAQTENAAQVEAGTLRIALTEQVITMDVHRTTSDYLIPLNIYERLFDIRGMEDGSSRLVNGLAEDYSVSGDGRIYHFTLRGDAFFSDGTLVKASDVAFTFTRMLAMQESVQTDFADLILGAGAVMEGKADKPEGIRVLDDRNLEIELSEPFAGYLSMLASPSCSILSEAFVTKAGSEYGSSAEQTIGSGPYRVTEFSKDRITMEQNPYYHPHEGEQLSVKKAEVMVLPPALIDRTFQAGGLDILDTNMINPDVVESVYKSETWSSRLITRNKVEIQFLMLNVETRPLDNIKIRRAVQMAIDRQKILDDLYGGDGTLLDGIYPEGLFGFSRENQGWLRYDPEEAKRLVQEVEDAGEIRLELAANSLSDVRKLTMLEMIRKDLSEAGLNVTIVNYDGESLLYLRRAGKLMSYAGAWSADFNDPDNFIYTFFGSRYKTRYRSSNYSNMDVISRINNARTIQNEQVRLKEYSDLERVLVRDEAVWVPLFSTDHLYVLGERVEHFYPYWAGWISMYLSDVILKEGQ